MGQQMTDRQRSLVTVTIQEANPCPKDIDDCLNLLEENDILTMDKARTFWKEFVQLCRQAMQSRHATGTRPPSPPTSAISPPSSAIPGTLHSDAAMQAAAQGSRDSPTLCVHLYNNGNFSFASVKYTNAEFSYIREKTLKKMGLQCRDRIVQIQWKDPNLPHDGDHAARATVFVFVSEEKASKVGMNVDVLFGEHCNEECDVQLQAIRASMDIQPAPLPFEVVQPDDSCAGSVAEATSPPRALESVPPQPDCAFVGPNAGRQAAIYVATYEAARQSGAVGQRIATST